LTLVVSGRTPSANIPKQANPDFLKWEIWAGDVVVVVVVVVVAMVMVMVMVVVVVLVVMVVVVVLVVVVVVVVVVVAKRAVEQRPRRSTREDHPEGQVSQVSDFHSFLGSRRVVGLQTNQFREPIIAS
jgi:Ca2+/Na+ antiporter